MFHWLELVFIMCGLPFNSTKYEGSPWPWSQTGKNAVTNIGWVRLPPRQWRKAVLVADKQQIKKCSTRLDGREEIQFVKSAWLIVDSELNNCIQTSGFSGIIKDAKHTYTHAPIFFLLSTFELLLLKLLENMELWHFWRQIMFNILLWQKRFTKNWCIHEAIALRYGGEVILTYQVTSSRRE